MAEISFDEEQVARPSIASGPSGMAGWMIRKGFAKDEKGASILLISIIAGSLAVAGAVLMLSGGSDATLDARERQQLEASTP